MKTYTHFVGIDIAKNKADVAWHNGKKEQIANTPAGVESFPAAPPAMVTGTRII